MTTKDFEFRVFIEGESAPSEWIPLDRNRRVVAGMSWVIKEVELREKPEWEPGWYCRKTNSGMVSEPHAVVYDVRYWKHQPSWATEQWIPLTDIDWDV